MRRFAVTPPRIAAATASFAAVVELAAVAVGELEAVDGLAVHRDQLGRVDVGAGARNARGDAVQQPAAVGAAHLAQRVPGRRLVVEADVGVGVRQRLERVVERARRSRPRAPPDPARASSRAPPARPGRVQSRRAARGTSRAPRSGQVATIASRMSRPSRRARPTRREQARTIPGGDVDPPLARVERQHRHARLLAPGSGSSSAACRAMSGPSCASRYARGACRIRSATYLSSPTMRNASAAAPLDQVARLEPGHLGLLEQVHHQAVQLVEALALPRRSAHRARASAGRAPARVRAARGGSRSGTPALPRDRRPCRAAARNRPESPTSSAISCSAAAPRSSRCTMRRASATGDASSPDGVEDERGEQQPLRMLQLRVLGGRDRIGRDELTDAVDEREAQDLRRVEQERVAPTAVDRLRELRQRALEHARRLEEAPRPDVAALEHREQLLASRRRPTAASRRSIGRSSRAGARRAAHRSQPPARRRA